VVTVVVGDSAKFVPPDALKENNFFLGVFDFAVFILIFLKS
jgi:hypothetical protein